MTYVDEARKPVVCNISFFNRNSIPGEAASLYFIGEDKIYPLGDVRTMFIRTEYKELRITSVIGIEELLDLFQSEKISLRVIIDSAEYTFLPDNEFQLYRGQFFALLGGDS